jgi:hypothetical protein
MVFSGSTLALPMGRPVLKFHDQRKHPPAMAMQRRHRIQPPAQQHADFHDLALIESGNVASVVS